MKKTMILKNKCIEAIWCATIEANPAEGTATVKAHWQDWVDNPNLPNFDAEFRFIESAERRALYIDVTIPEHQSGTFRIRAFTQRFIIMNPMNVFKYPCAGEYVL